MSKKPTRTPTPKRSIDGHSAAIAALISRIETAQGIVNNSPLMSDAGLRRVIAEIAVDARAIKTKLWPET